MAFLQRTILTIALTCFVSSLHAEQVVFGEIMYNPKDANPEYLEIRNLTSTAFDIAEWSVTDGVSFTFPEFSQGNSADSFLNAFETIVICSTTPTTFREAYGLPDSIRVYGPWSGSLSNAGERITLTDKNGTDLCSVTYNDRGDWPVAPDGTGHSLVLSKTSRSIQDPTMWTASRTSSPVPGSVSPKIAEEPFDSPTIDLSSGLEYIQLTDAWDFNDQNINLGLRLLAFWLDNGGGRWKQRWHLRFSPRG